MRLFIVGLIFLVCAVQASSVLAQDSKLHCAALDEDGTYKNKRSYKYLLAGDDGWLFRSKKDFKDDFLLTDGTRRKFAEFNKALKRNGVTLHIVMPPTRGVLHHEKLLREQKFIPDFDFSNARSTYLQSLKQLQLRGVSMTPFDGVFEMPEDFYYKRDHHWTLAGAEFSARKTATLLEPFKQELTAAVYKTEKVDKTVDLKGTFEEFVEWACDVEIVGETAEVYKTYKETDLFDESDAASIALIGTSNCTEPNPSYANFAGYLREYIGADIDNVSIAGGGIDTPILAYLASDDYLNKKHKHIIWELASHYAFNGQEFEPIFKQIIPAAKGSCGNVALMKNDLALSKKKTLIKAGEINNPFYVSLKFDTPIKKDFALVYKDEAGKPKRFRFKRSDRYPHDGVYFVNLEEDMISDLSLLMPKGHTAKNVSIEICPVD